MRGIRLIGILLLGIAPALAGAQETPEGTSASTVTTVETPAFTATPTPTAVPTSSFVFTGNFEPVEVGARYDDNVYRSVIPSGKFSDEVYLLGLGGAVRSKYDLFTANLGYRLGAEQYQLYSTISNLKNDFNFLFAAGSSPFSLYYKKDYFIRNSQYQDFNYFDDDNLVGVVWTPAGPWNYAAQYEYFDRTYYSMDAIHQSQNYVDQGFRFSTQREIDEKFSLKLEGTYNNRQFNRYAIASGGTSVLSSIQTDETWTALLSAHLYFESVLQDVTLEQQRTNSNSYGFSNSVQSVSWAAVVRPVPSFYLQLFFRLYSKNYDTPPLNLPTLQVGFVDEDGQDLLSLRTTWEWAPQWTASLGVSRIRNESTQPGLYYIKDIFSAQVRRNF